MTFFTLLQNRETAATTQASYFGSPRPLPLRATIPGLQVAARVSPFAASISRRVFSALPSSRFIGRAYPVTASIRYDEERLASEKQILIGLGIYE